MRMEHRHENLPLRRFPAHSPDLVAARRTIAALEAMLSHCPEVDAQAQQEVLQFQAEDGSFRLSDSWKMPADARVEFGYYPTYVASAVLMRAYLASQPKLPQETLKDALEKALSASLGRRLRDYRKENFVISCGRMRFSAMAYVMTDRKKRMVTPETAAPTADYLSWIRTGYEEAGFGESPRR